MGSRIALAAFAAAAVGLSAATPLAVQAKSPVADSPSPRQCFWTRQVSNFAAVDEHIVNIRVGVRDVYQLEMLGNCHDIDWAQTIAIRSRGSSSICTGMDAELIAPSPIGPTRCPVRAIRKLSPAEIAALPRGAKP